MERLNQWRGLLANLGVIAGILFFAYEIERNTNAVRSETYAAYGENLSTWSEFTASHSTKLVNLERYSTLDQIGQADQLVLFA